MKRFVLRGIVLVAMLASGLEASFVLAADAKGKLPKAAEKREQVKAKPQAPPAPQKSTGGSDIFLDKDGNGVDDRHETRVIRPENTPPPAVKPESKPAAPTRETPAAAAPAEAPKADPPTPPA